MSHKERMKIIEQEGSGGFALEEGRLDSDAAAKIQDTLDVSEIVAKYDKEATFRTFRGWLRIFISCLCILFSAFQLFTAATGLYPPQIQRSVHLGFVLVLIYLLYPARATGNKHRLNWYDVLLAAAGAAVCGYIIWNYDVIVLDAGPPTELDFIFGCASILLVLEATRRIVGLPITLVAVVFLLYAKFGNLIPGMMGHPGFSLRRIVGHMYLTTEGLFGMPLGVAASFVFLFILFGAFLHSTGLGKFFIDLALGAAGRFVGGPAKVAVLASGFFGTISGSSVANTVSTGTFTIPLMKSVGYRGAFAGAVEAASSTGGQIMPPIMGATAFVLAEMVQRPYADVMVAGFLPALLYFYSVGVYAQLQAKKLRIDASNLKVDFNLRNFLWEAPVFALPLVIITVILLLGYTPMFTIFWALIALLALNVADIRRKGDWSLLRRIVPALVDGAVTGAKIGVTCAVLGPIISTMTKTMLGVKIPSVIALWCHGSVFLALVLTALVCIILGCGLPTLAAYLIVSLVGVPTLTNLGVDRFAAHMFVFVFAVFSCITPPIATSAVPAAGIAGAGYMRTALESSKVGCVGFLIPFLVVFCPNILIVSAPDSGLIILGYFLTAVAAVTLFGVFVVGYGARELSGLERIFAGGACATLIWTLFSFNPLVFGAGLALFVLLVISQRRKIRLAPHEA